jgi:hypothetical protein
VSASFLTEARIAGRIDRSRRAGARPAAAIPIHFPLPPKANDVNGPSRGPRALKPQYVPAMAQDVVSCPRLRPARRAPMNVGQKAGCRRLAGAETRFDERRASRLRTITRDPPETTPTGAARSGPQSDRTPRARAIRGLRHSVGYRRPNEIVNGYDSFNSGARYLNWPVLTAFLQPASCRFHLTGI